MEEWFEGPGTARTASVSFCTGPWNVQNECPDPLIQYHPFSSHLTLSRSVNASVDPSYGTLHTTLAVPSNATVGQYSIQLYIPNPASSTTEKSGGRRSLLQSETHLETHHSFHHLRALAQEGGRDWGH